MLNGECDGISIADATALAVLAVCDNKRIPRDKVFKESAKRGKISMGWFYGFKLHTIINSKGELIRLKLTPGNVNDRKPMPDLCQGLFGQLFADRGYIVQWLTETLSEQGIQLITTLKKNMKPIPRTDFEKAILRRRSLIETVFDELNMRDCRAIVRGGVFPPVHQAVCNEIAGLKYNTLSSSSMMPNGTYFSLQPISWSAARSSPRVFPPRE